MTARVDHYRFRGYWRAQKGQWDDLGESAVRFGEDVLGRFVLVFLAVLIGPGWGDGKNSARSRKRRCSRR
jgi:hypothetical protein